MNIELEAAELLLAIESGRADLPEVIAWADKYILQSDDPKIEFIELSLVKKVDEASKRLREMSGNMNRWMVLRLFFKRFTDIKTLPPRDASQLARFLFHETIYTEKCPDDFIVFHSHWDDIDLAIDGLKGTVDEAIQAFLTDIRTIALSMT